AGHAAGGADGRSAGGGRRGGPDGPLPALRGVGGREAPAPEARLERHMADLEARGSDAASWAGATQVGESDTPPARLREYELLDRLGQGGMGTGYRAVHTRLGRGVALKVLAPPLQADPKARARFRR